MTMTPNKLNLREIIEMAIQIERSGAAFYGRLKELETGVESGALFQNLEQAEHRHIKDFEGILESALTRHRGMEYPITEEALLYLRAFASRRIFSDPEEAIRKAEALKDIFQALDMALDFELNSVGFYREMAGLIEDPGDRASVEEMERQEKEHAATLLRMRKELEDRESQVAISDQ